MEDKACFSKCCCVDYNMHHLCTTKTLMIESKPSFKQIGVWEK